MKITIKSPREIEIMREGGKILNSVLESIAKEAQVGVSTMELDQKAEQLILAAGAFPSFKGYEGFPAVLCTSLNEEVVHGIPSKRVLQSGDLLSLDCGVFYQGLHTDKALTLVVGESNPLKDRLMQVTRKSLELAASELKDGVKLGQVSHAIQRHVEQAGFGVVRDLVGHGIGKELHEDPPVPNFGGAGNGPILKAGMTIAIEPMVTVGNYNVIIDGWKIVTADNSLSAHFENTFLITKDGCEVLT
ncbi:MAG: type I methionyl aminopeptidase [Candidatus Gracilibacteria bacterium]|nr:type I methionyl aminopeptidase [Candidatus Gracilibacteria bacterium]